MEIYKLHKSIKRNSGLEVRYLISDIGNIKLEAYLNNIFVDEEYLSLGNCIYCANGELNVYHLGCCIYRRVYELFKGDIKKGYQIHHIDFNHYNNDVNNLECISAYHHGMRHRNILKCINNRFVPNKEHVYYNDYSKYLDAIKIKEHIESIDYTIEDSKRDLFKLYDRFEEASKVIRQQIKDEKHKKVIERAKQLEKEREENVIKKLQSEEYYINKIGRLCKKNKPKWTEERREKTMQTRQSVYKDPLWHTKISEGVKKYLRNKQK